MRPVRAAGFCILLLVLAPCLVDSQFHGVEGAEHMQESAEFLFGGGAATAEAAHGSESEGLIGESLEHHGEAAEAGHGEGEGHHEIGSVTKTTSYLLIGFMVTNFVMLWLVIYPDANIRSYTWKMMSSTISIYLAVLLNNAIRDTSLHVVLGSRCEEGSECANNAVDHKIELVIRFALFATAFVLTNVLCYVFRKSGRWMYAAQVLSGHIMAFAGIELFSNLRQSHDALQFLWSAFVFISLSLFGFRFASRTFRDHAFGSEGGNVRVFMTDRGMMQQEVEVEEWREAVCEAEDDGCSIFMSYMIKVVVMTHLFGDGYEQILEEHTFADLQKMLVAQLVFIAALVAFTFWRRSLDHGSHAEVEVPTAANTRSMSCVNIVLAMSMSWLSLKFFNCLTMTLFPGISEEFDEIISAAILTGCAILGILVLDRFADRVVEAAEEQQNALMPEHVGLNPDAHKQIKHVSNLEKAIRSIINSFALAVGLSWEKAFHAALHTVIESNPEMDKHYVISQGLLALGNCVLIMPVWLALIAPKATMSVQDHQVMMELSNRQS